MLRPMHRQATVLLVTILAGCASQGPVEVAQTAGNVQTVNCSGPSTGWVFCYRTAAQLCGVGGYRVVARENDPLVKPSDSETRTMQVECNQ